MSDTSTEHRMYTERYAPGYRCTCERWSTSVTDENHAASIHRQHVQEEQDRSR